MSLKLYLIRHGETDFNMACKEWGQSQEISLNDMGFLQSKRLAERLANIKFDKIFSSKLNRAAQTVEAIANFSEAEVFFDDRLREYDPGEVDPSSERWKIRYDDLLNSGMSKYDIRPFGGDNIWDLIKRVSSFLKDLEKEKGVVAVVAHSGVNAALMNLSQGREKENFHKIKQDNTCVNILNFCCGKWNIETINDSTHINDLKPEKKVYDNQEKIKEEIKTYLLREFDKIVDQIYLGGDLIMNEFGAYDRPYKRDKGSVIEMYGILKDHFEIPRKWKILLLDKGKRKYEIGKIIVNETKHKIVLNPIGGEINADNEKLEKVEFGV